MAAQAGAAARGAVTELLAAPDNQYPHLLHEATVVVTVDVGLTPPSPSPGRDGYRTLERRVVYGPRPYSSSSRQTTTDGANETAYRRGDEPTTNATTRPTGPT